MRALNTNEKLTLGFAGLALVVSLWAAWEAHRSARIAESEFEHTLSNERLEENAGWLKLKRGSWRLVDSSNGLLESAGRLQGGESTPEKQIPADERKSWTAGSRQILDEQIKNPALLGNQLAFHNWRLIEEDLSAVDRSEEGAIVKDEGKGLRPVQDELEIQKMRSWFFVTLVRKVRDEALAVYMETARESEQAGGFGPYKGPTAFPLKKDESPVKK
jgi:hypothetical protein